jgi:type I restriction enzyme S subunit
MNLKSFLENFGFVAGAPGGIEQIRNLIMMEGLRGNLSFPSESLPAEIDEVITVNKSRYYKNEGRKEKLEFFRAPIISEFPIPLGWKWKRVGEICDLKTGATPSRMRPEYFGGDIKWLVSGDINLKEIFECEGRITQAGLENSNCKLIPKDSVLIALNGQGRTRASVALLRVPAACNQSLVAMIPFNKDIILPEYLLISLKCRYFEIREITGQKQRRGLNMALISELSVPLAPLAEQHRIVAKVDELMTICDKLESQQQERENLFPVLSKSCHERFIANPTMDNLKTIFETGRGVSIEDVRKTVLDLVVRGRLVEQYKNVETAKDLLIKVEKKILEIANQNKYSLPKNKPLEALEDNPFLIPPSWQWTSIGNLAVLIDYGTSQKSNDNTNGVPVYRMGNIQNGIVKNDNMKYVPREIKDLPRLYLKNRDILFNRTNSYEIVGKTGLFIGPDDASTFASYLIRIQIPKDIILPEYVCLAMNAPYFRHTQIEPEIIQQCGQANFNGTKLSETLVPIPPLEEQQRIILKVNQIFSLIDHLEYQYQYRAETASLFAQAVVANITGTQLKDNKPMKAPKTELVTKLILGSKPKHYPSAPLAQLLSEHKGALSAKDLWQRSDLEIDEFYQQLKLEMTNGWIKEPEKATMKELV